jgi:hypothetical protein
MSSHMSKFGLLCQAARLLSQVLSHVSRNPIERQSHEEEGMLLDRTINAMISAAERSVTQTMTKFHLGLGKLVLNLRSKLD